MNYAKSLRYDDVRFFADELPAEVAAARADWAVWTLPPGEPLSSPLRVVYEDGDQRLCRRAEHGPRGTTTAALSAKARAVLDGVDRLTAEERKALAALVPA